MKYRLKTEEKRKNYLLPKNFTRILVLKDFNYIKLIINSNELKKMNKVVSNKIIYQILEEEMKLYIHSIQIVFI